MNAIIAILAFIGLIVVVISTITLLWYIITRRPTPDMRLRDAFKEIRYDMAFAFFIGPCAIVGYQEFGQGGVIIGGSLGGSFILFMILLQWWWGPV